MGFSTRKEKTIYRQNRSIEKIIIEENFFCLRGLSPKRTRFEIEYGLERGSSANSFICLSKRSNTMKEAIIIHPPGDAFADVFLNAITNAIPLDTEVIKVVVGHINPNRILLLKKLFSIYPQLSLICSTPGAKLLQEIWNLEKPSKKEKISNIAKVHLPLSKIEKIKTIETINVGDEFKIKLITTPTARWPGGLMAFEENIGLLMSDKLFGAHICTEEWAEINSASTEEERRHYFDCLMLSMSNQVDSIVEQLEELEIYTIAPGHGPAIERSWRNLLNDYRRWGETKEKNNLKIVLLFASAYGNTAAIADALAKGVSRTGIEIESINCEFVTANNLIQSIKKADAYLIGSPTIGGHAPTPIVSALGTLLAEGSRNNPIGIFGSYGWSGEALDLLENKLRDGGFDFGFDPIKIKFKPNQLMIKTLEETGTLFARKLLKRQQKAQRRASGGLNTNKSDSAVIALGRVVGSLCVLTTEKKNNDENLNGAMIASWVSQASFSPPGITVAVAKDRAVENLLYKEDIFNLNILSNNSKQKVLRQFLKQFAPGEDRFSGLTLEKSPGGQPIIPEALAWLEGCVKQRIECGDHWLIYAEIKHGKVLDPEGITAVHHRRTGANY